MPISLSYSGVPLLTGSTNSQHAQSGSGLIPLLCRRLFEIRNFVSTQIWAWQTHVQRLSQAALQSCTSYTAFDVWFRRLCISHWSRPLFYHGWIMVMRHWLANRPICLTISSLSSMRQPGLLLDFGTWSILQMLLPVFTGYDYWDYWTKCHQNCTQYREIHYI